MAKAVFLRLLKEKRLIERWLVDSAGTMPWYLGSEMDVRTLEVLRNNNYEVIHKVRQVEMKDFDLFDQMLAMTEDELLDLKRLAPIKSKKSRELLGKYDPTGDKYIEDPYFTKNVKIFTKTLEHCKRCCENYLKTVSEKANKN